MSYDPPGTSRVPKRNHQPTKSMKNHYLKAVLGLAAIGGLALLALTRITAGFVPEMTEVVSYAAVAILAALAAMDYRVGSNKQRQRMTP